MMWNKRNTPLHQAIIDDDQTMIGRYVQSSDMCEPNALGFSPVELAQLLGKDKWLQTLHPQPILHALLQLKGEDIPRLRTIQELEQHFHFKYRQFLYFSSYDALEHTVRACPYCLRSRYFATENHEWADKYREHLHTGYTAKIYIKWIDDVLGYGAFAAEDIPAGAYIAEYTGWVHPIDAVSKNGYCLTYPTSFMHRQTLAIDALTNGNLSRFFNHSEDPSLEPICIVDRRLLRHAFITNKALTKDSQLTFDYGADYWEFRDLKANTATKESVFRKLLSDTNK